jgi:hypothetical protein
MIDIKPRNRFLRRVIFNGISGSLGDLMVNSTPFRFFDMAIRELIEDLNGRDFGCFKFITAGTDGTV